MLCAAWALVALARILSAWLDSTAAFFSALARSRLRRRSSTSRWVQIGLPADVVLVERCPVGVEVEHPGHHLLEQGDVVADHDETAAVPLEEVAQPDDRVGVEVVGRLVEEQGLGAAEQDAGQLDPATLAAGERAERLRRAPARAGRGWRRSRRPRTRPRSRRGRGTAPRSGRTCVRRRRAGRRRRWPCRPRPHAARPAGRRGRGRRGCGCSARTSRSPVRGSCGR